MNDFGNPSRMLHEPSAHAWQKEAKILASSSWPLVVAFVLQYSLPVASLFAIGHLGTIELGAVSLGTMTANITGYAVYQGLATSLDTLCAQAYGSGHEKLVGLHLQRMVCLLWAMTIPIGIVWLCSDHILGAIVPEKETARLASLYLKILLIGAPGWSAFEAGKRFVQAQGIFTANLYVLLVLAPLNAFLHWLFVWHFHWGFIGAPIAVAVTDVLLPVGLVLYVRFVDGSKCWGGFSGDILKNWGPMIKLALPGFLMIEAEWLAFEILTLSASWLSSTHLAAQSILITVATLISQIPISVSIAASTRVANLIGASLASNARFSAKIALAGTMSLAVFNAIMFLALSHYIPRLFTDDEEVISLVARTLPLNAAFQLTDALASMCNGILRGIGRQEIGGYIALGVFYLVRLYFLEDVQAQVAGMA